MTEFEAGHPDELATTLRNWLDQANSPIGSLPEGMDPIDWAVRRFIDSWKRPIRSAIESLEESLRDVMAACERGDTMAAMLEIDSARQTIGEGLRGELGLYEWNKE
jgi:hypothetical protein